MTHVEPEEESMRREGEKEPVSSGAFLNSVIDEEETTH